MSKIDVTKCEFYKYYKDEKPRCTCHPVIWDATYMDDEYCEDYQDCYYRKLQREKQFRQQVKEILERSQKKSEYLVGQDFTELVDEIMSIVEEQVMECKYKSDCTYSDNCYLGCKIKDLFDEIDNLKSEIRYLKSENIKLRLNNDERSTFSSKVSGENVELKKQLDDLHQEKHDEVLTRSKIEVENGVLRKQNEDLKLTLAKIKELCKHIKLECIWQDSYSCGRVDMADEIEEFLSSVEPSTFQQELNKRGDEIEDLLKTIQQYKKENLDLQYILDCFQIEYIVDKETGKPFGRCNKLYELQNKLDKIEPILENYANSYMGEKMPDGTYRIATIPESLIQNGCIYGNSVVRPAYFCYSYFDPRPAQKGLEILGGKND